MLYYLPDLMFAVLTAVAAAVAHTEVPVRTNIDRVNKGCLWKQMYRWKEEDKMWKTHVGMTYKTFLYVLGQLKPFLEPRGEPNDMRHAPLRRRLLAVLVLFHTGCRQVDFSLNTGIPQSSISEWVDEIIGGLEIISPNFVFLPDTPEQLAEIATGFEHWGNSRLPMCVGAIDGTHIPVRSTDISYINCKGYKSINMQCVCDNNLMIRDVFGGFSGNMSDKIVFAEWEREVGFVDWISKRVAGRNFNGTNVCYYLVGDGGYTHTPGLQIPFPGHGTALLTPEKRDWNYWMSSNRICIEQCFGLLKGRWAILTATHRMSYSPAKVNRIFCACCVLHNICLLEDDWYPRQNYVDHTPGSLYDASVADYHLAEADLTNVAKNQRMALMHHLYSVHDGGNILDAHENDYAQGVNIPFDDDIQAEIDA